MKTAKPCNKNSRIKMTGLLTAVLVFAFLRSESRAQLIAVNMGVAFMNARVAPLWVAEKKGFFGETGSTSRSPTFREEPKGRRPA